MILKVLLLYCFVFTTYAQEETSFIRPLLENAEVKKTVGEALASGQIFQHPTPSQECHTDTSCSAEAQKRCLSKKAKSESCSEIYSGSWVTNCECL